MEISHVILIIVGCLFVFGMAGIFLLYQVKKAAVNVLSGAVDKTINRATEMIGQKVIDPGMAVATDTVRQGIGAVGKAVKDEFEDTKRRSPANIDVEVTRLAKTLKGKVTTADVTSQLKLSSKEAKDSFKRLKAAGDCSETPQGHYVLYVFSAFLEKSKVWCCDYCQKKFNEDPGRSDCSSCGANLEIREETMAV